ncbi:hypothetical protein F5Y10DRAFT_9806 [Nemania abortiva]|nr:hypothetical protein F5Y10DRAFT_9806 [Nemania abortiva]
MGQSCQNGCLMLLFSSIGKLSGSPLQRSHASLEIPSNTITYDYEKALSSEVASSSPNGYKAATLSRCIKGIVSQRLPHNFPSKAIKRTKRSRSQESETRDKRALSVLPKQHRSSKMSSVNIPNQPSEQSHFITDGLFTNVTALTVGNTSRRTNRRSALMPSHTFNRLKAEDCHFVHIGNTGGPSRGHNVVQPEVNRVYYGHVGDYRDSNAKREVMQDLGLNQRN